MLKVKIEGEVYKFPTGWEQITIEKYIKFQELLSQYDEETLQSFMQDDKDQTEFILFCAKVVAFWGGINDDTINKCDINDIYNAFNKLSKFFELPDIDKEFKGFKYKGDEYLLPEQLMKGSTLIEFLEGMQLEKSAEELKAGNWAVLPKIIAILARPKGEEYDSNKLDIRALMFNNLTMDIVTNIAFFLTRQNSTLLRNLAYSLEEEALI